MSAIPQEWLAPLELREVIIAIAEDLYAFPDWDPESEQIWQKYPGW